MHKLIKYLFDGYNQAIIVGTPDFTQNNQYTDIANIGNDIRYSMQKAYNAKKEEHSKPHKIKYRRKRK